MRPRFHQHWQRGLSYPALDHLAHLLYHYFEGSDPTPIYGLPNPLRFGFSIRLRYARSVKIGEVLEKLHEDGWFLIAAKGSHRQV